MVVGERRAKSLAIELGGQYIISTIDKPSKSYIQTSDSP